MVKMLLWLLLLYIIWRVVIAFSAPKKPPGTKSQTSKPDGGGSSAFSNIEDADFEDITPKSSQNEQPKT